MSKTNHHPKRGEIWYVELPNEPTDPHQPRTAIIVSRNGRNERSASVIVVLLQEKLLTMMFACFCQKVKAVFLKIRKLCAIEYALWTNDS